VERERSKEKTGRKLHFTKTLALFERLHPILMEFSSRFRESEAQK
jgi:hypothetical protein